MTRFPLFPEPGFDQSAMTPVLLGVLLSWLFTESFGWVFAGLVVPGYLASVFLLHPMGGLIDVIEALLTYGLARLLGEHLAQTGLTSRIFGRERFFLVVVASVMVRVVVEGVLLPALLPRTPWAFSMGLVVVPLAANACWKTGLLDGVVQNAVPTLLVYLVLRFLLVPYTNFSLSGFELASENVVASFLASPKAYILILTGAAVASAANVRYGWDFNGILVPALLALVVLEPVKLVATVAEAVVVLAVGLLLMRKVSLVGPRQTAVFFLVDYVLRFAFAWGLGRALPDLDAVGLLGFGYLLPTLLAVKMAQRDSIALVALPALKTSLFAFGAGTLIGYVAMRLDGTPAPVPASAPSTPRKHGVPPAKAAAATLWVAALGLDDVPAPAATKAAPVAWRAVVDGLRDGDREPAMRAGLQVDALAGDVLVVRERFEEPGDRRGRPSLLCRARRGPFTVVVPDAAHHGDAVMLAGQLLEDGRIDALLLGHVTRSLDTELEEAVTAVAGERGVVVELTEGPERRVRATVRDGRGREAVREVLASLGSSSTVGPATFELAGDAVAKLEPAAVPAVDLGTVAGLSARLERIPHAAHATSAEDSIALRRWVLSPLVGKGTSSSPVARRAARMLGYVLTAPVRRADGVEVVALLPENEPRPIALIVRADAHVRRIVEAPRANDRGTRDVALTLAAAMRADAVLLGLSASGATYHRDALRAAHGALLDVGDEVIVVRDAGVERQGVTALAAWGGHRREELEQSTRSALDRLGLRSRNESLDLATRELASRTLPSGAVLVAVAVDEVAKARVSLRGERDDMLAFARLGVQLEEATVETASERLARSLPERPAADLEALAFHLRAAVGERSVNAQRSLATELATSASIATLVHDATGDVMVVVARNASSVSVLVHSTLATGSRTWAHERRATVGACARAVITGGLCHVEGT